MKDAGADADAERFPNEKSAERLAEDVQVNECDVADAECQCQCQYHANANAAANEKRSRGRI